MDKINQQFQNEIKPIDLNFFENFVDNAMNFREKINHITQIRY